MATDLGNFYRGQYDREVARLVRAIHDMADRVERTAIPYDQTNVDGTPRHSGAASQTVHEINSSLMNIKVDSLIRAAAQLDVYEATKDADQIDVQAAIAAGEDEGA